MSIRNRYENQLKQLELALVEMCRCVECSIEQAIKALVTKDKVLARSVYDGDNVIDDMEEAIEQDCLKMLLLEHPVAGDFKEVSAILKMITDLERIGDQAADISSIILTFNEEDYFKQLKHIPTMSTIVVSMVKDSIHAYVIKDGSLLDEIKSRDNQVDELFEYVKKELVEYIKLDSSNADQAILFMMIAKYLERIGDHATNICEWTQYCLGGKRRGKKS